LPAQLGRQPECQEHFPNAHRPDPGPAFTGNLLVERSRKKTESLNEIPRVATPFQHSPKIKGNRKKKSKREEEIIQKQQHGWNAEFGTRIAEQGANSVADAD
jgi:hypothetical protein